MRPYLLSLAVGLLVGVIYALCKVRSPAPPVIALVGLLGILLGEQIPPAVSHVLGREPGALSLMQRAQAHMFGALPGAHAHAPQPTDKDA